MGDDKRASGVLLPISSIPSDFGIGGFSKEAYKFVDWVAKTGMKYWQILPLGPTGYGDSPYQSYSTFAGNPYFIDLQTLIDEELLTEEECESENYGTNPQYVDYGQIYNSRFKLLRKAYERSDYKAEDDYAEFVKKNSYWLDDCALYSAIKKAFGGKSRLDWDEDIRTREPAAIEAYKSKYADEIEFFRFQQYEFDKQWKKLKAYANKKGICIIGDIPIYVANDGADAWADKKLFMFDEDCKPVKVAGCPPDAFSATGQLWGNPLYDWEYHESTGYEWWLKRIERSFELYDVVRVDHFRGFDEFYAIPAEDETAENGKWMKGPGISLFDAIREKLGDVPIIAEDLGFLTESVLKLLKDTGFPGMKVLQFAFNAYDPSSYLPHNYPENCVVYTGTHDNDTTRGWYRSISDADRNFANEYMNNKNPEWDRVSWDFIRLAFSSVARLAIIPMQDFLELGNEARINMPSTFGDNWKWRMRKGEYTDAMAERIARMNWMYGRLWKEEKEEEAKEDAGKDIE